VSEDLNPHAWDISRVSGDHAPIVAHSHQDCTYVDAHEARYVFLTTYVLLGEILTLPDATTS
jgi:hypothetical protein